MVIQDKQNQLWGIRWKKYYNPNPKKKKTKKGTKKYKYILRYRFMLIIAAFIPYFYTFRLIICTTLIHTHIDSLINLFTTSTCTSSRSPNLSVHTSFRVCIWRRLFLYILFVEFKLSLLLLLIPLLFV